MINYLTYQGCKELKCRYLPRINKYGKVLGHNMWVIKYENYYAVQLHRTEIMWIYPDKYKLFNGGWRTKLTAEKLSKYSPVNIYSLKKIWRWYYKGTELNHTNIFEEGMEIPIENLVEYLL